MPFFTIMIPSRIERIKRREYLLVLYTLERKWGVPADLYHITSVEPDYELGRVGESVVKYHIPRFVTQETSTKLEFGTAFPHARHQINFGGIYSPNDRVCVFRNIFGLPDIDMKDYIVYAGNRYVIQQKVFLDYQLGWILHIRHTPDVKSYQSHDKSVWSRVTPSQDIAK